MMAPILFGTTRPVTAQRCPVLLEDSRRNSQVNLRKLTLKQLEELSAKIEARREQLNRQNAGMVRQQVLQTIRDAGLTVEQVLQAKAAKAPAAAAKAPAEAKPAKKRRKKR